MQETIMQQGFDLMLYGMGTVFVFLTVLVISTAIMSSLIERYFPEPEPVPVAPKKSQTVVSAPGVNDPKLLAIIKAAVDQHRNKHK